MARVTLRDKASGEQTRFFLTDDGRLDVDTVLVSLEAKAVKLVDGDGSLSVLQRRPDGLSYNVFHPDDAVDVSLVLLHPQDHQQYQGPGWQHQAPGPSSRRRRRAVLDVDDAYISAELVAELDDEVNVMTKVYTWDEFKSGKLTTRGDPQVKLVKYEAPSFIGSIHDEGWDHVYTTSQHREHMKTIDSWLQLPRDSRFGWLGSAARSGLKKVFYGISVGSKNSEVLVGDGRLGNAVLGVSIYKKLAWPGILRTHFEYLLWAVTSDLPYMQLLTDMCTGGLFYVCRDVLDKRSVVWIVVMEDIGQVKECFQQFGSNLPKSFREFSQEQLLEFRTLPYRAKFPYPGATYPPVEDW